MYGISNIPWTGELGYAMVRSGCIYCEHRTPGSLAIRELVCPASRQPPPAVEPGTHLFVYGSGEPAWVDLARDARSLLPHVDPLQPLHLPQKCRLSDRAADGFFSFYLDLTLGKDKTFAHSAALEEPGSASHYGSSAFDDWSELPELLPGPFWVLFVLAQWVLVVWVLITVRFSSGVACAYALDMAS